MATGGDLPQCQSVVVNVKLLQHCHHWRTDWLPLVGYSGADNAAHVGEPVVYNYHTLQHHVLS